MFLIKQKKQGLLNGAVLESSEDTVQAVSPPSNALPQALLQAVGPHYLEVWLSLPFETILTTYPSEPSTNVIHIKWYVCIAIFGILDEINCEVNINHIKYFHNSLIC